MNIKKVDIMGLKVKVTTKTPKELLITDTAKLYYGHYDRESNHIWINKDIGNNETRYRTLFHEMGHATFQRSGVSFSGAIPMELEEILVETNANVFYEFMANFIKDALKEKDIAVLKNRLQSFL